MLFLDCFNINGSDFFVASDYFSSSIDIFLVLLSTVCLFVLSQVTTFISLKRKTRQVHFDIAMLPEKKNTKSYFFEIAHWIIMIVFFIVYLVSFYTLNFRSVLFSLFWAIIYLVSFYSPVFFDKRKFTKKYFYYVFSFLFVVVLSYDVLFNLYKYQHYSINTLKKYTMVFKQDMPVEEDKVAVLSTSSNYVFLINSARQVTAVAKDKILTMQPLQK